MDLLFSDEESFLQNQLRELLARACPLALVSEVEESGYFPAELWHELGNGGWLLPDAVETPHYVELAILCQELGRVALPGPITEQLAVTSSRWAREVLAHEQYREVTGGRAPLTIERDAPDREDLTVSEDRHARGEVGVLPYGIHAEYVLTRRAAPVVHLLSLPAGEAGVERAPHPSLSGSQLATIRFERAPVAGSCASDSLSWTWSVYDLLRNAYALGLLSRITQISLEYVKNRVQFGRPIGSFQSVQQRCVEMHIATTGFRHLVYQTAWLADNGEPERAKYCLALASTYARGACRAVVAHGHQVHGAIGFTMEYPLGIFTRRAKAHGISIGDKREEAALIKNLALRPSGNYG